MAPRLLRACAVLCLLLLAPCTAQVILDVNLTLSSYQTSASNVSLFVLFRPQSNVPAGGELSVQTYGTTSQPPAGGARTPAQIRCDLGMPGYSPIPNCSGLMFSDGTYAPYNPYNVLFPNGLPVGPSYVLTLGGLYNRANPGTDQPGSVFINVAVNGAYQEVAFETTRFTYATFVGEFRLSSYVAGVSGVTLTAYFYAGQVVNQANAAVYLQLSAMSGPGVLNCSQLWNASATPLPGCRWVSNGNPYRIGVTALNTSVMYSFSISNLTIDRYSGTTASHLLQLQYGTTPFNTYSVAPFNFSDTQAPTIANCPPSVQQSTDLHQNYATVTWTPPTAADNIGVANFTSNYAPPAQLPFGFTQVVYTAMDAAGNVQRCSFNVTVVDTEAPRLTCPASVVAPTSPGRSDGVASWATPAVVDNVDTALSAVPSRFSGSVFSLGSTTVRYDVTDSSGNAAFCTFTVTIADMEKPSLACPANLSTVTDPGLPSANVSWATPTPTDNVNVTSLTVTAGPGSRFLAGTTAVTYQARDAAGNLATCTFNVTVRDNQVPVVVCPPPQTVNTTAGTSSAPATWANATATDNVGVVSLVPTLPSGTTFPLGPTTVTYTAADAAGLTAACSFIVTVVDREAPQLACPQSVSRGTDLNVPYANVSWAPPPATDNVGVAQGPTCSPVAGSLFSAGFTTVVCRASDVAGNVGTCSFSVTIYDTEPPRITCPNDIVQNTDPGLPTAVVTWPAPNATDNAGTPTVTVTKAPGSVFPLGATRVTYQATDSQLNTAACSFTVTVQDKEKPRLTCPANISQSTDRGSAGAIVTWVVPTATDNVGLAGPVQGNYLPLTSFPAGLTIVTYSVSDTQGNTATCSFGVFIADLEPPVIICPANIVQGTSPGLATANVTWADPAFSDNVQVRTIIRTRNPGSTFVLGTTLVVYTAIDTSGNAGNCSFTVTVVDRVPPSVACPVSQILMTEPGKNYRTGINWTAPTVGHGVSDNVGVANITSSRLPGTFPVGTTRVNFTATDTAGNTRTCSFSIAIIDRESPIAYCPGNIVEPTDPGKRTRVVSWPAPNATDNVGVVAQQATYPPGTRFSIGTVTVSYIVRDNYDNTNNCSWTVTVLDVEKPQLTCPADVRILLAVGQNASIAQWPTPVATDNDRVANLTATRRSGEVFQGRTNVTYTAVDPSGNAATCSFLVVVSAFWPTAALSTPRTRGPSTLAVMFKPEADVPALGTVQLWLPGFTGAVALNCSAPGAATPLPGCVAGIIGSDTTSTGLLNGTLAVLRLSRTAQLTAGVTYGFGLSGLVNPARPGLTDFVALRTYTAAGYLLDENRNVTRFDLLAVLVSTAALRVTEGTTTFFTLALDSAPGLSYGNVTVALAAAAPVVLSPPSVCFTASNWSRVQQVLVTVPRDYVANDDRNVTIVPTLVTADPRWVTLRQDLDSVGVVIKDVDVPGLLPDPPTLVTSEAGTSAAFAVQLRSQPTATVLVNVSSDNLNEVTANTSLLTFTAATWNVSQPVLVTGVNDWYVDGDQLVHIQLLGSSVDAKYNRLAASVNVTNLDNDVAGLNITSQDGNSTTYERLFTLRLQLFDVRLTASPYGTVTVTLGVNGSLVRVEPPTLTFDGTNWARTQPVGVWPLNDLSQRGNLPSQVTLNVTASTSVRDVAFLGVSASVIVISIDDDVAGVQWSPNLTHVFTPNRTAGAQSPDDMLQFMLQTMPLGLVTVVFTPSDPLKGQVVPSRVNVTPAMWNVTQTVAVQSFQDVVAVDTPFSFTVTFDTQDPFYRRLSYTFPALALARQYNASTVATSLLSLCVAVDPLNFDMNWFIMTLSGLFNLTLQQVNVDSSRACTTVDLTGVDSSQWYWVKFKPQALTGGTNVWFNFVGLPAGTNLLNFETAALALLNTNPALRAALLAAGVAGYAKPPVQRSVFYTGCPRTLRRYFSVQVSVVAGVEPYSPISPVVWAVRPPAAANALWVSQRYANDSTLHPLDGLRLLAETGNASALLAELAEKAASGLVGAFGAGAVDPRQLQLEVTAGQTAKFGFYASPGDYLNLAAKLSRTNDRFVGNSEVGQPLFDADCVPLWGKQVEMFLWDAGTAVDQPFWANLYVGRDSRQLYGGSYALGQLPAHDFVRQLNATELSNPLDLYPPPGRLVRVSIDRGLDVTLQPLTNAFQGGNATVEVTLPPDAPLGNALHVEFPPGWFRFNANGVPTKAVVLSGLAPTLPVLPNVTVDGNVVQLRFGQDLVLSDRLVVLLLDSLVLPPVCGELLYRVTTHACQAHDVHNAGKYVYEVCGPALTTAVGVPPNGMPRGCDACNACVFEGRLEGQDRFACTDPDG
eukprot:EG_transcript_80